MIASILAISLLGAADIQTFQVDGVEREATIVLPSRGTVHPIVFGFHGHGGNMRNAARSFGIAGRWPEAIVVYMQGLPTKGMTDPEGKKNGWQQKQGDQGDRDLKFFDQVHASVIKIAGADRKHVFTMGHSNGGRFTQLLWEQRGDLFAGVGPSGSFARLMKLPPKPAFMISGEKDPIVSPALQRATHRMVIDTNGGDPSAGMTNGFLTKYAGKFPTQTYIHPGGHEFPQAGMDLMIAFFKSIQ